MANFEDSTNKFLELRPLNDGWLPAKVAGRGDKLQAELTNTSQHLTDGRRYSN